jgi:hypothetical protein
MHGGRLAAGGLAALLAACALGATAGATGVAARPRAVTNTNRTYAFLAVSCPTTTWCTAVGDSPGAPTLPLAEAWNGTSWTTETTPDPAGAKSAELTGVSCTSTTSCVAVGYEKTAGAGVRPPENLSEIWNGTAWTIAPVPGVTGDNDNLLNGVSCPSASYCVAVGIAYSGPGPGTTPAETVAELWNGSVWSLMPTPNPAGNLETRFNAVSCPSTTFCEAVGFYDTSGNDQDIFSESWDGSAWTLDNIPQVDGVDALEGVSCVSATSCFAGGFQSDAGLIEQWNGSGWTPDNPAVGANLRDSVSCATAHACMATGLETVTEWWNGQKWGNRGAIEPPGKVVSDLWGVSCPSVSMCMAAGQTGTRVVAEIWTGKKWVLQNPKF